MIDVEKVIGDKNPRLLKLLPGFIIRYLKRILHQEDINTILEQNKDLYDADFCHEIMNRFNIEVSIENIEKVPKTGGVILACNHPLGGLDALALVDKFHHYRPDIKFIVNDILLNLKNLTGLFAGVNKHGANAVSSLQQVNDLFKSDLALFIFPAGLVSRKEKGVVKDLEWKKTFVTRARKYQKPIVPVFIDGHLSSRFYRVARWRKFFGIKANLEMLYLSDEQFRLENSKVKIVVGDPVFPESMNDNTNDKEWTLKIRELVYNLSRN